MKLRKNTIGICAAMFAGLTFQALGQAPPDGFLGSLPLLRNSETRSISAENPKGEKGGGATAVPDKDNAASDLGAGWKVRPAITLPKLETTTLADVDGPGTIQHIWITVDPKAYRDCILRFYWDGESSPSIEVPLGDFFVTAHNARYKVDSLMMAVNPSGGFNSYWPMPFRKHVKITVENQRPEPIDGFFYQITYALEPVPANAAYLHAQWRRSLTTREHPEHTLLDGVKGEGQYVGTFLAWEQLSNGWWGEAKSSFTSTATGITRPSMAPARRTISAAPGVSATPSRRLSRATPITGKRPARSPSTRCIAGTCWTRSVSNTICA